MSLNLLTYKTMGTVYRVGEVEYTQKGYAKCEVLIEIPYTLGSKQKTDIIKFKVFGDDAKYMDQYKGGDFVEIMFRLNGYMWKPPDKDEEINLTSLRIVDIHKRDNPFETKEIVFDGPDNLSPDPVVDMAKKVKDWVNEKPKEDVLFDENNDDLPF